MKLRRATYYMTESLIRRLKHRSIDDQTDASATVRKALEAYLGPVAEASPLDIAPQRKRESEPT